MLLEACAHFLVACISCFLQLDTTGPSIQTQHVSAQNLCYKTSISCSLTLHASSSWFPFPQVIKAVLRDDADPTRISLLLANVAEGDILLRQDLDDLAASHPDRFKVNYILSAVAQLCLLMLRPTYGLPCLALVCVTRALAHMHTYVGACQRPCPLDLCSCPDKMQLYCDYRKHDKCLILLALCRRCTMCCRSRRPAGASHQATSVRPW